jgi:transglycosylase-like protein with SLT domain
MAGKVSSALAAPHGFRDSVRWRVTPKGVEVNGKVERTPGDPVTVTHVWELYHAGINAAATKYGVPVPLIIATICTESSGRADALRLEPGFVSDAATPNLVSPGLMQTLISTARSAMGNANINRAWLLKPANSIMAGTAYIKGQAGTTKLDPPLVGAAYNAGSVYYNGSAQNRWKLRQYPIGKSDHLDRFIPWFNDACAMLATHPIRPTVGLEAIIGDVALTPTQQKVQTVKKAAGKVAGAQAKVGFGPNANANAMTPYSKLVLNDILHTAGVTSAVISSTQRSPADQARAMFENLERVGVKAQKDLYGPFGDMIIDVYAQGKAAGKNAGQIQKDMTARIIAVGPTNVSHHAADPKILNVFDIAPTSIPQGKWDALERAVRADPRVKQFFRPPQDPGFHLEIPQPPK